MNAIRVKLGWALTALLLLAVLSTALLVQISWIDTSSKNIESVVGSLNERTASSVLRGLGATFKSTEGAAEIIRSIVFHDVVKTTDEVKREFVFLSVLQSQPTASWVGYAFPDGRFFGAHALDNGDIEMVEIGGFSDETARKLRIDRYHPLPGDIFFEQRTVGTTQYVVAGARWFRLAKETGTPVWTTVDILPSGFEPAAVFSRPLLVRDKLQGIIMVSLNRARIAQFLMGLDIASFGVAQIVDGNGTSIATSATVTDSNMFEALKRITAHEKTSGLVQLSSGDDYYVTSTALDFNGWRLLTAIPRSAFTKDIDKNNHRLLLVISGLSLLAALSAAFFAHWFFARPMQKIAAELPLIETFELGKVAHVRTWLSELDDLSGALKRLASSLVSFSMFVPIDIVKTLVAQGVQPVPGGETRDITVLFADIPGFTTFTEKHGASVAPFLTTFLTLASEAIDREGGTVDKFIGDCIMGIWNAPGKIDDHPLRACRAALRIRELMRNVERPDGEKAVSPVRIGINTGNAFVGNIGSSHRLSYTAIGDAVNIASRLEGLGKELGADILIGEATAEAVEGRAVLKPLGQVALRGRKGKLAVFELVSVVGDLPAHSSSNSEARSQ